MDKKEEKEIEYLNAQLNRLWTGIIVLGGGIAGLMLTYSYSLPIYASENIAKLILFIIGFIIFIMMMLSGIANLNIKINKLFKERIN
jgi:hypothetical protein